MTITAEQARTRASGIGGSDAAAVCGVDQYRQPADVWLEKVRGVRDESIADKEVVKWGNILEAVIAREWAERNGKEVYEVQDTLRSKERPWQLAHPDRLIVGEAAGLEIKARSEYMKSEYGRTGSDNVLPSDIMQCHHYMAVLDYPVWYMAILLGGNELRSFVINRNDEIIDHMNKLEDEFWNYVTSVTLPPINYGHNACRALMERLYPDVEEGEEVVLPVRAKELQEDLGSLKELEKGISTRKSAIRNELRHMIGNASIGRLHDGSGGWRRKRIEKDGYEVKPSAYIDMRFSKKL
jgi:putative phage-type endonuclease